MVHVVVGLEVVEEAPRPKLEVHQDAGLDDVVVDQEVVLVVLQVAALAAAVAAARRILPLLGVLQENRLHHLVAPGLLTVEGSF